MSPAPLREVRDAQLHGGKAASLGAALRAGLPVPGGLSVDIHQVRSLSDGGGDEVVAGLHERLREWPVAVRSSAVGEDSAGASFAGQHLSLLNVAGVDDVLEAIDAVHASAHSDSAIAYRRRLGLSGEPQVAVVVQTMVAAECAGVLFTRDPISGADERVVEASWGLGEAVVSGLVTPDRWHLRRGGEILKYVPGFKDIEIRPLAGGGTEEAEVPPERAVRSCLSEDLLQELDQLGSLCERHFGHPSDIEWAVSGGRLYLLQCRPITR